MAGFDYAGAQKVADDLIGYFGTPAVGKKRKTWIRTFTTGNDRWKPAPVPSDTTCNAVFPFTQKRPRSNEQSQVEEKELRALVSALGLKVKIDTQCELVVEGDRSYGILSVDLLDPAGTPVYYVVRLQA